MRMMLWIIQTLILRSWLIIAGVGLGLLARSLFPSTAMQEAEQVESPSAKIYFDRMVDENAANGVKVDRQ